MKRLAYRLVPIVAAGVLGGLFAAHLTHDATPDQLVGAFGAEQVDAVQQAFVEHADGRQLQVRGAVERTLADDRDGSPHQRFIIRTNSGISLLIAHNLDLAPRLDGLAAGEQIRAFGEYVWNEKGGVLHWTHDDPAGRHPDGYIEWRGRIYQ